MDKLTHWQSLGAPDSPTALIGGLLLLPCLLGAFVAPKQYTSTVAAKVVNSHYLAQKFANEYAAWRACHSQTCPESLDDVRPPNRKSDRDLWGRPFIMRCGDDAPPGDLAFGVTSVGRDGILGTRDDIHSWAEPDMAAYATPRRGAFGLLDYVAHWIGLGETGHTRQNQ